MDRFVNRTDELSRLQTLYDAELAVIFGRRPLVQEAAKERDDLRLFRIEDVVETLR